MTHVPYKVVASVMTALLGGELQIAYSNPVTGAPLWKAGRLRPLAMSGLKRSEAFPEIPTIDESGVRGYEALIWYGYMAPAKTSRAVIDRLHRDIVSVLKIPEVDLVPSEVVLQRSLQDAEDLAIHVIFGDAQ